jgi:uncharacterized protein
MAGDASKSAPAASEERLLSPATVGAVSGIFAQLVAFGREQRRLTEFPMGAQLTMEDVVRELLHPMMRDWLDKNAMPIVERIVQAELAQVLGRSGAT